MTALQLVNQWQHEGRLNPRLYELLIRRLTYPPYSTHSLDITGISAAQLKELIANGEIGQVRGIGARWLGELKNIIRLHHPGLYMDTEQLMRLSERDQKGTKVFIHNSNLAP